MADLPGKELAQELMQKNREESRRTPMEAVILAAKEGRFHQEEGFCKEKTMHPIVEQFLEKWGVAHGAWRVGPIPSLSDQPGVVSSTELRAFFACLCSD